MVRRPPRTPRFAARGVCHPSPIASADQITTPPPTEEAAGARPARPSVDEVRAVGQPPGLLDRSCEQWGGRMYMRRLSPHVTRALLVHTPLTANGVTWLMILTGLATALVITLPGILPAVAAVLLIQLQLLFDCVDGEMARWQRQRSAVGIYLDRIAHAVTESGLPIAIGIRADGGWDQLGTWTIVGLAAGFLILFVKLESALVAAARAEAGRPPVRDAPDVTAPRGSGLRRVRRAVDFVPLFRLWHAVEASLLVLAAAVVDQVAGHLVAIVASSRLR